MMAYILNLADLAFTLCALRHGAWELNRLMRCVPVMVVYKLFIIGALCRWLYKREERVARYGLKVITAVYAAVNVWHIVNAAVFWAA